MEWTLLIFIAVILFLWGFLWGFLSVSINWKFDTMFLIPLFFLAFILWSIWVVLLEDKENILLNKNICIENWYVNYENTFFSWTSKQEYISCSKLNKKWELLYWNILIEKK